MSGQHKGYRQAVTHAMRESGLSDYEIARLIGVSPGYFSKLTRAVGEAWARRVIAMVLVTRSRAPLEWMAQEVGCEIVPTGELSALRARVAELEGRAAA